MMGKIGVYCIIENIFFLTCHHDVRSRVSTEPECFNPALIEHGGTCGIAINATKISTFQG